MKVSPRALAVLVFLAAACGDGGTGPAAPAALAPVSSVTLSAAVGAQISDSLAVRVLDANNKAMPNVQVSWAVTSGGGSVSASSTNTNAQGTAKVAWTLGTVPGENKVAATVGGLAPVVFTATASAGPPAAIAVVAGANQSAVVATPVPVAPSVVVKDAFGNPIAGVQVSFFVATGGGSLTGAAQTTNAAGIATVGSWTLGTQAGKQTISAGSGLLPVARIDATALAGAAATLAVAAGNGQRADAGATVATAPAVLVKDEYGNLVAGEAVTFTVTAGGGSVTGATAIADANGRAAVGSWRLGDAGGLNILEASAAGGTVSLFANARPQPRAGFQIDLHFTTLPKPSLIEAVENAVARWQGIITSDQATEQVTLTSAQCVVNFNEAVDDITIVVSLGAIDGPGGILGQAGPCWIRDNILPAFGLLQFDTVDMKIMETAGIVEEVFLHEIGHVLGIGTLWCVFSANSCADLKLIEGRGGNDPYFTGPKGRAAFLEIGGDVYEGNSVPVENVGGAGSADGHWRESLFAKELMTSTIGGPGNPLSLLTIESLVDIGYSVDRSQADAYAFKIAEGGNSNAAVVTQPFHLREVLNGPLFRRARDGTVQRLR